MLFKLNKILLFLTIGLISLSACTPSTPEVQVTPTPAQQVVLIWWNMFEPEANVKPLIDAYVKEHPNVTIQYNQKGLTDGVDGYKKDLDTALTDNDPLTTPDIFTIHNTWQDNYTQYIVKAPASIISQQDLSDFYQTVKDNFAKDGTLSAIPLYLDAISIIYNKDKLTKAGFTVPADKWSDFKNQALVLTEKTSGSEITSAGFSARDVDNSQFYFDMLNLLLLQNGVQMTDVTGNKAIFSSQNETKDAIDFYSSFVQGSNVSWNDKFKKDIAVFIEKKLAMYAAPSWRLIDILNYNNRYSLGLNVGVAPVPQIAGENIYWASYWGQTVSRESIHADVAWDFLKYITGAEQLRLLNKTVKDNGRPIGIIYPRQSMSAEQSSDEFLGPYVLAVSRAKTWNMKDGYKMKSTFDLLFKNSTVDVTDFESKVTAVLQGKAN